MSVHITLKIILTCVNIKTSVAAFCKNTDNPNNARRYDIPILGVDAASECNETPHRASCAPHWNTYLVFNWIRRKCWIRPIRRTDKAAKRPVTRRSCLLFVQCAWCARGTYGVSSHRTVNSTWTVCAHRNYNYRITKTDLWKVQWSLQRQQSNETQDTSTEDDPRYPCDK